MKQNLIFTIISIILVLTLYACDNMTNGNIFKAIDAFMKGFSEAHEMVGYPLE